MCISKSILSITFIIIKVFGFCNFLENKVRQPVWRAPVIQHWGGSDRRIMGSRAACTIQVQTSLGYMTKPHLKKLKERKETLEGKVRAKGSRKRRGLPQSQSLTGTWGQSSKTPISQSYVANPWAWSQSLELFTRQSSPAWLLEALGLYRQRWNLF